MTDAAVRQLQVDFNRLSGPGLLSLPDPENSLTQGARLLVFEEDTARYEASVIERGLRTVLLRVSSTPA